MKAHQRKARLKRARQHHKYWTCPKWQEKNRQNTRNVFQSYRDELDMFENYIERGNKWRQQAFNQLVIFLGVFFSVLLGLWWLAVRSA